MQTAQVIELFAGRNPEGQPVVERIPVEINDQNECRLVRSPAFVKGLARGDLIRVNQQNGEFELRQRSGNLCIRVFSRGDIRALDDAITPELEKLGGQLDFENPRVLVYSIHVSCGFNAIETVLNAHLSTDSAWFYGNVYDPEDGVTPLNWWQAILAPE
ncbi:MAG: DUF4265 domain-containing protein [Cellvibrionaceae bacterium]|nr:DUF4265 domain-containing protein [Cellvibrionaceae bacterium]